MVGLYKIQYSEHSAFLRCLRFSKFRLFERHKYMYGRRALGTLILSNEYIEQNDHPAAYFNSIFLAHNQLLGRKPYMKLS